MKQSKSSKPSASDLAKVIAQIESVRMTLRPPVPYYSVSASIVYGVAADRILSAGSSPGDLELPLPVVLPSLRPVVPLPGLEADGKAASTAIKKAFTPLEVQLVELRQHDVMPQNMLLMVQLGYRMRLVGRDARVAARRLGIFCNSQIYGSQATGSGENSAGESFFEGASVPVQRALLHASRLLLLGYYIVIVEQVETRAERAVGGSSDESDADEKGNPNVFGRKITKILSRCTASVELADMLEKAEHYDNSSNQNENENENENEGNAEEQDAGEGASQSPIRSTVPSALSTSDGTLAPSQRGANDNNYCGLFLLFKYDKARDRSFFYISVLSVASASISHFTVTSRGDIRRRPRSARGEDRDADDDDMPFDDLLQLSRRAGDAVPDNHIGAKRQREEADGDNDVQLSPYYCPNSFYEALRATITYYPPAEIVIGVAADGGYYDLSTTMTSSSQGAVPNSPDTLRACCKTPLPPKLIDLLEATHCLNYGPTDIGVEDYNASRAIVPVMIIEEGRTGGFYHDHVPNSHDGVEGDPAGLPNPLAAQVHQDSHRSGRDGSHGRKPIATLAAATDPSRCPMSSSMALTEVYLRYFGLHHLMRLLKTVPFAYQAQEQPKGAGGGADVSSMRIPKSALVSLEVFDNASPAGHRADGGVTLYSFLNKTLTAGGARLLRGWLAAPLVDRRAILERQLVVLLLSPPVCPMAFRRSLVNLLVASVSATTSSVPPRRGGVDMLAIITRLSSGRASFLEYYRFMQRIIRIKKSAQLVMEEYKSLGTYEKANSASIAETLDQIRRQLEYFGGEKDGVGGGAAFRGIGGPLLDWILHCLNNDDMDTMITEEAAFLGLSYGTGNGDTDLSEGRQDEGITEKGSHDTAHSDARLIELLLAQHERPAGGDDNQPKNGLGYLYDRLHHYRDIVEQTEQLLHAYLVAVRQAAGAPMLEYRSIGNVHFLLEVPIARERALIAVPTGMLQRVREQHQPGSSAAPGGGWTLVSRTKAVVRYHHTLVLQAVMRRTVAQSKMVKVGKEILALHLIQRFGAVSVAVNVPNCCGADTAVMKLFDEGAVLGAAEPQDTSLANMNRPLHLFSEALSTLDVLLAFSRLLAPVTSWGADDSSDYYPYILPQFLDDQPGVRRADLADGAPTGAAATPDINYDDFYQSRAGESAGGGVARGYSAVPSAVSGRYYLLLSGVAHPLLAQRLDEEDRQRQAFRRQGGRSDVARKRYARTTIAMPVGAPRCWLMTGANMAGKSVFMKMIAVNVILAQIGAPVACGDYYYENYVTRGTYNNDDGSQGEPTVAGAASHNSHAKFFSAAALLPLFSSVRTRVGASDSLLEGSSTFLSELAETRSILSAPDLSTSLLLIDELGRGTSSHDGVAVADASLRYIAARTQASLDLSDNLNRRYYSSCCCLFVTHYHLLCDWYKNDPRIALMYMDYRLGPSEGNGGATPTIKFLYQPVPGICPSSFGIVVAAMAHLPPSVLAAAAERARRARYHHNSTRGLLLLRQLGAELRDEEAI